MILQFDDTLEIILPKVRIHIIVPGELRKILDINIARHGFRSPAYEQILVCLGNDIERESKPQPVPVLLDEPFANRMDGSDQSAVQFRGFGETVFFIDKHLSCLPDKISGGRFCEGRQDDAGRLDRFHVLVLGNQLVRQQVGQFMCLAGTCAGVDIFRFHGTI